MAETAVEKTIKWLQTDPKLEGFTVTSVVPSTRPGKLILVQRTGGEMTPFVDRATLTIDIITPTQLQADQTAENAVKDRILSMDHIPNVGRASIESAYQQPSVDTKTKQYEINCRVVSLID